jgi:hypothetical protein
MSPSEFDLRAALHDGEDGDLNVDQLIERGRARVTQRRVRLLSGAAIVAVVAGVATGGTLLATADNGSKPSLANAQDAGRTAAAAPGPAAASGGGAAGGAAVSGPRAPASPMPSSAQPAAAATTACPQTLPRYSPPGGGSPGQFGASGPLFSKPVATVVVCGYGSGFSRVSAPTHAPARLELHDGAAARLVASLESAPKVKPQVMCPDYRTADVQQIAIIGVTSAGTPTGTPVTTTIGLPACDVRVTNGTAIRYDWSPPADIARRLVVRNPVSAPVIPVPVSPTK